MTSPTVPTATFVPDITTEGTPVTPSAALNNMLSNLMNSKGNVGNATTPAAVYQQIYNAIMASPNLIAELNQVAGNVLLAIQYSPNGSGAFFDSSSHSIVISQSFLNSLQGQVSPQNALTFVLGHETYHAMDASSMQTLLQATQKSLATAIPAGQDVTQVLLNYANARLADEANANFSGWNALVGTLGTAAPTGQQLADLANSTTYSTLIVNVGDGSISGRGGISLLADDAISNTVNGQATLTVPNTADEMPIQGAQTTSTTHITYTLFEDTAALDIGFSAARGHTLDVNLATLGLGAGGTGSDPFAQLAADGFTAGSAKTDNSGSILDTGSGATASIGYNSTLAQLSILYATSNSTGFQLDILPVAGQTAHLTLPNTPAPAVELNDNGASADVTEVGSNYTLNLSDVSGVTIGGVQLTGTNASVSVSAGNFDWTGSDGTQYQFQPGDDFAQNGLGTLQIGGGALGSGETVTLDNFNLTLAQTQAGYAGIHLAAAALSLTFGSTAGTDPLLQSGTGSSGPNFTAGSAQTYAVSVATASNTPQTITVTLSGVPSSDFAVDTGSGLAALNDQGTFTVTIAAGDTSASFSLDNTGDVGQAATLQLSAKLPDPNNPGATISSGTLTQSYVEPTDDPFVQPASPSLYLLEQATDPEGQPFSLYTDQPVSQTPVGGVGSGNNYISVSGGANQSIAGGSGNDTIWASFGNVTTGGALVDGGVDVITGNGGSDMIIAGSPSQSITSPEAPSEVRIYAGSQVDLATALANASSGAATGAQGDLIISDLTNATLVGSNGNDLILDGGNDLVVAGPGDDTIVSGVNGVDQSLTSYDGGRDLSPTAGQTWSDFIAGANQVFFSDNLYDYGVWNGTPAPNYEGNYDNFAAPFLTTNATIFGGSGNDLIELSNGNNDVELGTGSATVLGGMGNNTIIGGGGANLIVGGGGSDYIELGDGTGFAAGQGGNNTLFGGAGSDTIYAGSPYSDWATGETGNNYVQAGSGNTLIDGSGGNDTLIGSSGNNTIQGGSGNESIVGGTGDESINGGAGNETLVAGGAGTDTIWAGAGSTTIYGGDGTDYLNGGSGTNVIYAGDGGTVAAPTAIFAGSGATTLYGGAGIDNISGGSGTDVIYAGDGGTASAPTQIFAGTGNTTVYGGGGLDYISGGSGMDVLHAGGGGTDANPGLVSSGSGPSTLYGGAGASELADSLSGQDLLVSETADDTLIGTGSDTLVAGTGNDVLQTNSSSVSLVFNAGFGDDTLLTGGGTENLSFGTGIAPTDFVGSQETDSNGNGYLVLSGDGGSLAIEDALTGGLGTITFADSGPISLDTLLTDVFDGDPPSADGTHPSINRPISSQARPELAGTLFIPRAPAAETAFAYVDPVRLAWLAVDRPLDSPGVNGSGAELEHEAYDTATLLSGASSSATPRVIRRPGFAEQLDRMRV